MHMKTTMRYHLILFRKAISQKAKVLLKKLNYQNPCTMLVGMQNGEIAMENTMQFTKKNK